MSKAKKTDLVTICVEKADDTPQANAKATVVRMIIEGDRIVDLDVTGLTHGTVGAKRVAALTAVTLSDSVTLAELVAHIEKL